MAEAAIRKALLSKRFPKKSGMVAACKYLVITRVLRPRITHASKLPIKAFPIPIQVLESPYFHPNCPAYPTNTTAEK